MDKKYTVPEDTCVYAVGDIHGRLDLLVKLHRMIEADRASRAAKRAVLVYVGDYIDRGAQSREVLDLLIHKPLPGFGIVHLRGNHEHAMMQFIEQHGASPAWLFWGGLATIASYGVPFRPGADALDTEVLASELREHVPEDHRVWLNNLKYSHEIGDYLFVHAGIRPGVTLDRQTPSDMMTIRDEFFNSYQLFDKAVVFGHTVFDSPLHLPDRIGIDTGAFATGVLTALVLEGESRSFLHTGR